MRGRWSKDLLLLYRGAEPHSAKRKNNVFFGKAFFFKERFIGTIIGMLLGFVGRVILVRFTTQTEYGIYCLALVIISIFVTISTLGLNEDSTRYIAYFNFMGWKKVL